MFVGVLGILRDWRIIRNFAEMKDVQYDNDKGKTLYISDMDGTLLGTDSQVSAASAALLADLSRRGAMVTVATARTPATVVPLLRDCRLHVPAIVMTGAALWNWDEDPPTVETLIGDAAEDRCGRFVDAQYIDADDYAVLDEMFATAHVSPFRYIKSAHAETLTVYHTREMNTAERAFYEARARLTLKHFEFDRTPESDERRRCMLCFAMGEYNTIERVARAVSERTQCAISFYPDTYDRNVALLEVFAPGVSKAAALRRLKADTGARRVVVFGDNLNDLPMMRCADVAVAVANALPEVKAAADIVIGANSEDAVARYIAEDFAKGE